MKVYDSAGQLKIVQAGGGGGITNIRISAGTTSNLLSDFTFSNSNGISFGLDASTITAAHNALTSQSNQAFSADASSTFQTLSFQNSNQISFSNNAGAIRITHDLMQSTSRPAFSADASSTFQTLTFQNSNGVSFSNNAGALRVTHDLAFSSQTNLTGRIYVTAQSTGQSSSSTYDLRTLSIVPDGIISAGWSNGSFRISATQSNQAFSADASSTFQTLTFQNSNGVSFSNNAGAIRVTHDLMFSTSRPAFSAQGGSSTFQTLLFNNINGVSFSNNTGAVQVQSIEMRMFAVSNTTQNTSGTANHSALSFGGAGLASVGVTNGSVVVSVPAGAPSPVNFSAGTTSGDLGSVVFSNSNGVSFGLNGSTITASVGAAGGGATISSYENIPGVFNTTQSVNQASISMAVAFQMPQAGSFSFLRIPVSMTTRSTTIATTASSRNFSCDNLSTWNAVIYSMGVGANSKSLQSVASGSNGWTMRRSISVAANGTQYSVTLGFSAQAGGGGTTRTTQYSISNTNYSFTTNQIATEWSGGRMLDIPMNTSLSAGPYWLIFGCSTSSVSGGDSSQLSVATNCGVFYSNHFGFTRSNITIGIMGSTNMTSGGLLGVGSFSTAGGGTTASLHISAISSTASHVKPYFQLLRSA